MPKKLYHIHLTAIEREQLETYVTQGTKSARAINRARICVFRSKVATDSGRILPPIPVEGCH